MVVAVGASLAIGGNALLLRLRGRVVLRRAAALGAVVHAPVGLRLGLLALLTVMLAGRHLDVDVGDAFIVARKRLVLVRRLGVLCDDVPSVQEAGEVAEDGEEDVDEGVGATDAALDPDYER